jgi:hypothetical protein
VAVQANAGRTDGVDEVNIPFARNSNLTADDMAELRRQGITIDDDTDPAPENIPIPELRVEEVPLSWQSDGIICPRRAANLQNTNACFMNYSREDVMKMSKLEFFSCIVSC